MIKRISFLLYLLLTLSLTWPSHAQTVGDEGLDVSGRDSSSTILHEVVITENRLLIPFHRLNRNVQIIGRDQIESLPARSINELLGHINGVDLRQRGPFGTQADIGIDGGTFEQALILINGIKILDPQTGHNTLNLPIPLDAIERIEVIRGPAARIYGINSLTGAINIVTKKPEADGLSAHIYGGSSFRRDTSDADKLFHGRGAQLGWQTVGNQHRHSLYGGHESGNGYRYNTAFRNNRLYYQGDISLRPDQSLSLMGGYVSSNFGANGFYAAPGDIESQEIVQTALAAIGYRSRIADRFTLAPRVSYRYGYDDYRYFRHDLERARSQHYTHTLNTELNGTLHTEVGDLGLGLETRHERISSSNIGNHSRDNYGLYTEFRTEKIQRIALNLGAYFNYNTDYGWQVFPGLDIGYQLAPQWRVVAHTGTGQRIPSFTDLYLDQRPGNIGNPNLRSENAWQAEAGIRHDGARWNLHASYFYREINSFIDWVRDDLDTPWQPINFAGNTTHGSLFSFQYRLANHNRPLQWNTGLAYTFLSPAVREHDTALLSKYAIESLRHQLTAHLSVAHQRFSATATARFNERISYKSYVISDVRLRYNTRHAVLYLDLQNLFDVTYIEAAAVPMPGRWFSLGINYTVF